MRATRASIGVCSRPGMHGRLPHRHVTAADPTTAARATMRALQAGAPRSRAALVAVLDRGGEAGLVPAPWTITGVVSALAKAEMHGLVLYEPDDRGSNGARSLPAELAPIACDDAVAATWPGAPAGLRIPGAWIGRRLCLVVPCVIAANHRFGSRTIAGPVTAGLAALAAGAGVARAPDPARIGEQLAARVFCHVSVIVDASWTALVETATARRFLATEQIVGVCLASPTTHDVEVSAAQIDGWLVQRVGTEAAPALADRSVQPLWRISAAHESRPRPGPLGQAWHVWSGPRSS